MASNASFASTPRLGAGALTVANTNRDGTGTVVNLFTAGASGSRIERIIIKHKVTTSAGMIRFFLYDGATYRALTEVNVGVVTVSGVTQASELQVSQAVLPLILPTTWSIVASTEVANACDVLVFGADF